MAFRRGSVFCDDTTISSGSLISSGSWVASSAQSSGLNVGSAAYRCTEFSVGEDWSAGENSFSYTFPDAGPWEVR